MDSPTQPTTSRPRRHGVSMTVLQAVGETGALVHEICRLKRDLRVTDLPDSLQVYFGLDSRVPLRNVQRAVRRLIEKGFARRIADPSHGKRSFLYPTDQSDGKRLAFRVSDVQAPGSLLRAVIRECVRLYPGKPQTWLAKRLGLARETVCRHLAAERERAASITINAPPRSHALRAFCESTAERQTHGATPGRPAVDHGAACSQANGEKRKAAVGSDVTPSPPDPCPRAQRGEKMQPTPPNRTILAISEANLRFSMAAAENRALAKLETAPFDAVRELNAAYRPEGPGVRRTPARRSHPDPDVWRDHPDGQHVDQQTAKSRRRAAPIEAKHDPAAARNGARQVLEALRRAS